MQCTFFDNSAASRAGTVYVCSTSTLSFANCTFAYNTAPSGGGLYVVTASTIANCIVAFNGPGEGVWCDGDLAPVCTDIYGNAGGDWVGCLAGQGGLHGNLSADPLFCDAPARNLTINAVSPCNAGECGLIGAWPVGCPASGVDALAGGEPLPGGLSVEPNPMTHSCRIAFATEGGPASVEIASASGRMVRRLLGGVHPAGTMACSWDGRDDAGRPLPSGVYLARIRAGERSRSVRLVVLH